ncbi:MAG: VWA domain-containing protein, partial [Armatimonadota bacterium]|nr:VWA domain-containing protein [Armatimonadota bacterium]
FRNPSSGPVEAIYTFPLPHDAAVDGMSMQIGDRIIKGEIKRKEEAREIYEAAKAAGKSTALLDQERPNIFTQSVANIMPGNAIQVTISYVNLLKYDEGKYEFVFPMVVGPRYTPGGGYVTPGQRGDPSPPAAAPTGSLDDTSVVTDADKISPPIATEGTRAGHDISLSVHILAGVPLDQITSVLHAVNIDRKSASEATVSLQDQKTIPNKDFILRFTVGGSGVQSGMLVHSSGEGSGFFTLILQPPPSPAPSEVSPKEMIFVIDQTGSQSGWPIEKAKETMKYCMSHLNPGDTFQLLGFNTDVFPCFPKPVEASAKNIAKAQAFLAPIEGNGGTDILKSVEYSLKLPTDPARPRIICYMTDGFVGNDMQIIDYIKKNRGSARMFPFGVGNSVNRFLIDGMARQGRGVAEYVTLEESGQEAAEKFYKRIAQPLLLDVKVNWHGLPVRDIYPRVIPDVFSAGPIILKGRYSGPAEGDVTVSGLLRGRPWQQTIHVQLPEVQEEGSALQSLWARDKITDLQDEDWMGAQLGKPDAKIKEAIVTVALENRLMSQWTSFVAVEQRIVNVGGQQKIVDVPVELPEGVAHKGIFGGSARGQAISSAEAIQTNTQAGGGGGGDPYIAVEAPENTRQVVAIFPTGDAKNLLYDDRLGVWNGRFDIPFGTPAGDYRVTVILVRRDGARTQFVLTYQNLLQSSIAAGATMLKAKPGETIQLKVSGTGIHRAVAVTPWGDRIKLSGEAETWNARLTVPDHWQKGTSLITVILLDGAHNRTQISVDLDVE